MTQAWGYDGAPRPGAAGTVTLIEGVTFCICGRSGDVRPGTQQGLFHRDTRFLSRFEVTVDGESLEPLDAHCPTPYAATFIARRPPRPGTADSTLLVIRRRYVGNGLLERITVRNLGKEAAAVTLTAHVDSDFAGLFEVKEGRPTHRDEVERDASQSLLRLGHRSETESRAVTVTADHTPTVASGGLAWRLVIDPRSDVVLSMQVVPNIDGSDAPALYRPGEPVERSRPAHELAAWRRAAPAVHSADPRLNRLLAASAEDLGTLRIIDPQHPDRVVVAAGAPWFMTLFGRDALLTSWMLLPLDRSIALGTLRTLADLQGKRVDRLTEEEPGRIMHEIRSDPDAEAALGGRNVYYGSVDATPLFVMCLGELRRWGLPRAELDELIPVADRALTWVEHYGDRDGDGFVEYQRATDRGLVNQGWKDSFDAISFAAGELAEPPIALAEVQGYVYAAYLARAHFAQEAGEHQTARRWAEKAAVLKRRFNDAFWLADRGYYALALDRDKQPVDALASNMGHCLWTGIVDEDKAPGVAAHLLSPEMFTGFGVRTLAATMGAYNPISYHNGSVWPHDNAIIAAGLMRYGFVDHAQRIGLALLDAADRLGGRLPELFCGFDRSEFDPPVPYPTACAPQAWAAVTPLHLLRTLTRFDPWIPFGRVWCDPAVPDRLLPLRINRLHLGGAATSLTVDTDGWTLTGLPEGIELIRGARSPLTAATPPHLTTTTRDLVTDV